MSCNYALSWMVSFNEDKVSHTLVLDLIPVVTICVQWRQENQNGGEACGSFFLLSPIFFVIYLI